MALQFEQLEARNLLAINVLGAPNWVAQGPGPITNAGNVIPNGTANSIDVGAITSIAVDSGNANHVYVATVNGGIWQTMNANAASPHWTTTTDQLASLAISTIAFSPTNTNVVYAGTGSYSSLNGAINSVGVGGSAVGLYKTTDGGATWSLVGNSTFNGLRVERVVPTALNGGQTVFAATFDTGIGTGGVYRSDDGGQMWAQLSGSNNLPSGGVSDLLIDPNNGNIFYTAIAGGASAGIYRLDVTGGNSNWTNVTNNLPAGTLSGAVKIELSITTAGAQPIWAGVINSTGFMAGVFRGVAAGATINWTAVGPGGQPPNIYGNNTQGATHFAILADNANDNFVYVGGDLRSPFPFADNIARGDSTANTWTAITALGATPVQPGTVQPTDGGVTTGPHADSRRLVFDGNDLLLACDGGIYRCVNPTAGGGTPSWSSINGDLQNTEFYSVAIDNRNNANPADDLQLGAAQDNGANARDTAGNWTEQVGGDGVVVQADNTNDMQYFEAQNFFVRARVGTGGTSTPAASVNGGAAGATINSAVSANTYANSGTLVENLPFKTEFRINGGNVNRILVGGASTLYESTDQMATFTSIGGLAVGGMTALAVPNITGTVISMAYGNVVNNNVAYIGTNNGNIFFTSNIDAAGGGFAATDFSTTGNGNPLDIVVDPNNANIAYVVTNIGVFQTTNGMNWTAITNNLLQITAAGGNRTLGSIALFNNGTVTTNDDVLLVGGLGGVFRRAINPSPTCGNMTWSAYGQGLPNVYVDSLAYDPQGNELLAGTFGRGAWLLSNISGTINNSVTLQIVGDGNANSMSLRVDPNNPLRMIANDGIGAPQSLQIALFSQVQIQGLAGNDTITVGSSGGLGAGSVKFVAFPIVVDGGDDSDTLNLEDFSDPLGATVTITSTTIGAAVGDTFFGSCGQLSYSNLESISLDLSNSAGVGDLVNANSTSVPVTIHGNGGNDQFNVGNGDLTNIVAPVAVFGDAGSDSLLVDDRTRTSAVDYHVDPTTIEICATPADIPIAIFDGTLEFATLHGTAGVNPTDGNQFDVTPSADTTFTIDGDEPHIPPGDYLSIRFAGTTGRKLTFTVKATGTGMWTFGNRKNVDFTHIERFNFFPVIVYSAEAAALGKPTVKVVDAELGTLITSFQAYESTYRQGVRVAVGDVNGDGLPEVITAPGHNHTPLIEVWSIVNATPAAPPTSPISTLLAYNAPFKGGVNLAIGDVTGDGLNDLITAPNRGKAEIHTYINQANPTAPFDNIHRNVFLAFGKNFQGGAMVAAGDVLPVLGLKDKAEILVGSGPGTRDEVRIFDGSTSGSVNTPAAFLVNFFPFPIGNRGGVNVAVAQLDNAIVHPKLQIVVGANVGGQSRVSTFDAATLAVPTYQFFAVFTGSGFNAPVRVASIDSNFDGISDIFAMQGFDGKSQALRRLPLVGSFVDLLLENDPEFHNGFFIAADASGIAPFLC